LLAVQEGIDALFDALAAIGDAEPVACGYVQRHDLERIASGCNDVPLFKSRDGANDVPVYTHPAPRPSAALYAAASKGFHVSETCGPDGKYWHVSKFPSMDDLFAFEDAWRKTMIAARDAAPLAPAVAAPVAVGDEWTNETAARTYADVLDRDANCLPRGCSEAMAFNMRQAATLLRTIAQPGEMSRIRDILAAEFMASQPQGVVGDEMVIVETVGFVRVNGEGDRIIDWTLEGGIHALEPDDELVITSRRVTNDEGYGEVAALRPDAAQSGGSNG
jgi:hypothetical protein